VLATLPTLDMVSKVCDLDTAAELTPIPRSFSVITQHQEEGRKEGEKQGREGRDWSFT